ncbi:MAG: cell division protease FtsH [Arenicella sp.]|jgi:cell division protease FtsH
MFSKLIKRNAVVFLILFVLFNIGLTQQRSASGQFTLIPYSQLKAQISTGGFQSVTLKGDEIQGTLGKPIQVAGLSTGVVRVKSYVPLSGDDSLLGLLEAQNMVINVVPLSETKSAWSIFFSILPFLLIVSFYFWMLRRAGGLLGGGMDKRVSQFLKPKSEINDTPPSITFDDVAGQENAKHDVSELLDYIRNPQDYQKLGASVPTGVLLMGPPGTGKTLLARALAGEAGVPFCSISASEFIEMYVGVGAARVRALFNQAKAKAPSIIFIDEIDAVGRVRGTGLGGGNDEREQTLNQILSEMDGFSGHQAVIVIAATNRPDVLDPALLRPGRFDRHVMLELPDLPAREAILKVHTRDVPLCEDINLEDVARETPGFSGADLKNLVNEAAMNAARSKAEVVGIDDFKQMRDKVVLGSARKLIMQPEEKHRLAIHEAGHTAAAYYLENADPVYKVSIIPRGRALGATQQLPENERYTLPLPYLQDRLVVMLAGRVAEKEFTNTISSGADDDIKQATSLARAMVTRWGMSDDVGPVDLRESDENPFLGRDIAKSRSHSEESAATVDRAVKAILLAAEQSAYEVIRRHQTRVIELAGALEEHETLDKDAIATLLDEGSAVAAKIKPNAAPALTMLPSKSNVNIEK